MCGDDGVTYANLCQLRCQQNFITDIDVVRIDGPQKKCDGSCPCNGSVEPFYWTFEFCRLICMNINDFSNKIFFMIVFNIDVDIG